MKFLLLFSGLVLNSIKGYCFEYKKVAGYIIFYRDSMVSLGSDHAPNHKSFNYFFEKELDIQTIDKYFNITDTAKYIEVDKPWGGLVFINNEERRKQFYSYLDTMGITFKNSYKTMVFDHSQIPSSLLESIRKFISIYKFEGWVITGVESQNNLNNYSGNSMIIVPDREFKFEYTYSVVL